MRHEDEDLGNNVGVNLKSLQLWVLSDDEKCKYSFTFLHTNAAHVVSYPLPIFHGVVSSQVDSLHSIIGFLNSYYIKINTRLILIQHQLIKEAITPPVRSNMQYLYVLRVMNDI